MLTRIMSSMFMGSSYLPKDRATGSRCPYRQRLPAPHGRGVGPLRPVVVDLPLGKARQHLVEGDPALQPRQGCAEAEVDAVAERLVASDLPVDVERVAVGEVALVPVGRAVQHH